jgi:hypothetical protein
VSSNTYLDQAEPFVREYLARGGQMPEGAEVRGGGAASGARPETAFQGVIVLIDLSKEAAEGLQVWQHCRQLS